MKYYVTIITRLNASKEIEITSDRKLSVKELWETVNIRNCKAMYATSDKNKMSTDIRYHYFNTDDDILKLMTI